MANYSTSANNNDTNAWKAFDNKTDTNWTASYTTTGELVFNFGIPTTIKGVRFTPVSGKLSSFPKTVVLKGNKTGDTPVEIQTFTLTEPSNSESQSFRFDPVKYATYTFQFGETFATATGTKEVAIAEIDFLVSRDIVIPEPKLQEKTVAPTRSAQTVMADSEYDGLSKVMVEAISLQEKMAAPATSEQTIIPDASHDGLSKVTVSAATLQTKTVTPSTSQQVITPDSSYYGLSKVTVNAAAPSGTDTSDATASASDILSGKTAYGASGKITGTMSSNTLVTPTISVSSAGKITASVTQSAGYTAGGTKSATNQLTVQSAKTWTPTTSSQTISSGTYLTGTQTISGDSNLVASNIKSGVSIFGVSGSYAESSTPQTIDLTFVMGVWNGASSSAGVQLMYPTVSSSGTVEIKTTMLLRPGKNTAGYSTTINKVVVGSMLIIFSEASQIYTSEDWIHGVKLTTTTTGYSVMTGMYNAGSQGGNKFEMTGTLSSVGDTMSGIVKLLCILKSGTSTASSPKMTLTESLVTS